MSDDEDTKRKLVFGEISGIPVGRTWKTRRELRMDGMHGPLEGGIDGNPTEGATSVVLSGGYKDDKDNGKSFQYTGTGGQNYVGMSRGSSRGNGGLQLEDQTFENFYNKALQKSSETRRPVRVIRGKNPRSSFAPGSGYRYDGLYIVDTARLEPGEDGQMVCKYSFRRVEGQPKLPGIKKADLYSRMLKKPKNRNLK